MQARLTRLLAVLVVLATASACEAELATSDDAAETAGLRLAEAGVVRVVDGDTIIVALNGREERLRYIGIDAPESVTPDQPVECFGVDAGDENERLVAGRTVYLEADVEDRDRFGRLLRYVYVVEVDGSLTMVNELLVEGGFAEAGSYSPNERHEDELRAAERRARSSGVGLWGWC